MSNPFASIEQTLNAAAVAAVGNASMLWGGHIATGVFSNTYLDSMGMSNSQPSFQAVSDDLPDIAAGESVSVTYGETVTDYTVRAVEADGTGLIRLVLEAA